MIDKDFLGKSESHASVDALHHSGPSSMGVDQFYKANDQQWGEKVWASSRYTPWTSEPTFVFLTGCFGTVGLEQWLGLLLIPEPPTRAATNTRGASSWICSWY